MRWSSARHVKVALVPRLEPLAYAAVCLLGLGACGNRDSGGTSSPTQGSGGASSPTQDTGGASSPAQDAGGTWSPTQDAGGTLRPTQGSSPTQGTGGASSPTQDAGDDSSRDAPDAALKLTGKYVAMGSSFAAGPSIPDAVPGQACGRSTGNYAHLVAANLGLDLTEVSCSGATSDNVAIVAQAPNPLQIDAVTPDTRLVTITVGGNDVNYALSLTVCGQDGASGVSCLASGQVNSAAVNALVGQIEGKLVTMLKAVQQAAPNARVYLVAYPMVLPDPPTACPPDVPMLAGDAIFLGQVGSKLQAAFGAAATAAGVHFVDVYGPSHGHDACAPEAQRWVEGQATAGAQAYHPNARGMRAQADLIIAEIQRTF